MYGNERGAISPTRELNLLVLGGKVTLVGYFWRDAGLE